MDGGLAILGALLQFFEHLVIGIGDGLAYAALEAGYVHFVATVFVGGSGGQL